MFSCKGGEVFAAAAICLVCALPGLLPAVAILMQPVPVDVRRQADQIQVYDRLDHHLDPQQFPARAWLAYAALLAVWLGLCAKRVSGTLGTCDNRLETERSKVPDTIFGQSLWLAFLPWRRKSDPQELFCGFVVGALAIAATAAAIGFGPRWAGLLKFYPFRLADLMLPIAVAIAVAGELVQFSLPGARPGAGAARKLALPAAALAAFGGALLTPPAAGNPGGLSPERQAAWQDVCAWIDRSTPRDALWLTPRYSFAFKWYARRAEYATWKDCPQDAASLVEWKRRLDAVRNWRRDWFRQGFSEAAFADLRARTGVDYVVDWLVYPYQVEPVYRNAYFGVFPVGASGAETGDARR